MRVSWDEAATLVAAAMIHTIKQYGPDRIFGFTPIPAMSMVSYASGARFLSLIGGSLISFYDWYCDLPPASPQVWGDQTDVPESADWYNASYMIVWGTNLPMTRSPDAHFYTEARYRGAKVTAVSPDYAEYVKFADTWLPVKAGTDSALAMAMTYRDPEGILHRPAPREYFTEYAKSYTDLPFAVILEKKGTATQPAVFSAASDLGFQGDRGRVEDRLLGCDQRWLRGPEWQHRISLGGKKGSWNLHRQDSLKRQPVNPLLSFEGEEDEWVSGPVPVFRAQGTGHPDRLGAGQSESPATGRDHLVTTVFDLMAANLGIDGGRRGCGQWITTIRFPTLRHGRRSITGFRRGDAIRVAREFAENAEKTRGKSMIFLGAGTNHWYHCDMIYRTILNLTTLCGCQGVNGGGWAHYVGQEKVRPLAGWTTLAFGLDWLRPPRLQNGTSFFYFATTSGGMKPSMPAQLSSPWARERPKSHLADYNAVAARLGWLPYYPQFNRNPIELCRKLVEAGAGSDEEIVRWAVEGAQERGAPVLPSRTRTTPTTSRGCCFCGGRISWARAARGTSTF